MPAEKRQAEAARIRDKYPDRIPVRACLLFLTLAPCMCCLMCGVAWSCLGFNL